MNEKRFRSSKPKMFVILVLFYAVMLVYSAPTRKPTTRSPTLKPTTQPTKFTYQPTPTPTYQPTQNVVCPDVYVLLGWQSCNNSATLHDFYNCVGCSNVTVYKDCTKSMSDVIGISVQACEINKSTCAMPIGKSIVEVCTPTTDSPSTAKVTDKPTVADKPTICPDANVMFSWQPCADRSNIVDFSNCVGCGTLIKYDGCSKSISDVLGMSVVMCKSIASDALKDKCDRPVSAAVNEGCATTSAPSHATTSTPTSRADYLIPTLLLIISCFAIVL